MDDDAAFPCTSPEACRLKHLVLKMECHDYTDAKFSQMIEVLTKVIYAILGCAGAVGLMVLERLMEVLLV